MLHRVDALRKTHRRFLDDSPSSSLPKAPSQNENQTLPVLCKACSSPVFSSIYSSLTFPQTCDTASRSPGPAVPSGGHLACTPTFFWPLFRYRFNSGPSLNIWENIWMPACLLLSTPSPALMFFPTAFITVYYIYIICIICYTLYMYKCINRLLPVSFDGNISFMKARTYFFLRS